MRNNNAKCSGQADISPYSVDHKECIFVLSWQLNKSGRDARFKTPEVTGYYNTILENGACGAKISLISTP